MQHSLLSAKCLIAAAMLASSTAAMAYDYYSITPAPGEVTELSEMILTINGSWEQVDRTKKFSFTGPEGVEVPKLMSGSLGADGYSFSFEDDAVITTPGEYTLYIPEGRFGVNGQLCPAASFTWTIASSVPGGNDESVYNMTPAPGEVHQLSEMVLSFNGEWAQGDRSKKYKFTGPEGVDVPAIMGYSDGKAYNFYFEDDAVITDPGQYSLYIPEGRFTVNGVDAPETTFVWTVVEGGNVPGVGFPQYAIMPEPGDYESLSDGFMLLLDTEETVSVSSDNVYLDGPAGEYSLYVECDGHMPVITVIPVDDEDTPLELTQSGDYTLIFSVGAITVGETANDEPLVFVYHVGSTQPQGWSGDYTADPADDSTVSSLKAIDVTFDAFSVVVAEFAKPSDFPYLVDNETMETVAGGTVYAEENVLYISLSKTVTTPGYYTLVIPSQLIKVNGLNPDYDIYLSYEVAGEASSFEYSFTLSPADGENIGAESPISITFSGDDLASVANDPFAWGRDYPHFTNEMDAYNPNLAITAQGMTFTFTHQWPFEVGGEYTLIIPAGYFTLTSVGGDVTKNDRIEATYSVKTTSITSVTGDEVIEATYTLQGVRIGGNAMPAGVYIVNGKKTYLK